MKVYVVNADSGITVHRTLSAAMGDRDQWTLTENSAGHPAWLRWDGPGVFTVIKELELQD